MHSFLAPVAGQGMGRRGGFRLETGKGERGKSGFNSMLHASIAIINTPPGAKTHV